MISIKTEITATDDNMVIVYSYITGKLGPKSFDMFKSIDNNIVINFKDDHDAAIFEMSNLDDILNEIIEEVNATFLLDQKTQCDDLKINEMIDELEKYTKDYKSPLKSPYSPYPEDIKWGDRYSTYLGPNIAGDRPDLPKKFIAK